MIVIREYLGESQAPRSIPVSSLYLGLVGGVACGTFPSGPSKVAF